MLRPTSAAMRIFLGSSDEMNLCSSCMGLPLLIVDNDFSTERGGRKKAANSSDFDGSEEGGLQQISEAAKTQFGEVTIAGFHVAPDDVEVGRVEEQ